MIDDIVKKTTLHLDRAKLALAEIKGWGDDFGCDIFEYSEIFKKKASLASLLPLYAASFCARGYPRNFALLHAPQRLA